jgi:hypothetical protein
MWIMGAVGRKGLSQRGPVAMALLHPTRKPEYLSLPLIFLRAQVVFRKKQWTEVLEELGPDSMGKKLNQIALKSMYQGGVLLKTLEMMVE